jgi:hypothetical protein
VVQDLARCWSSGSFTTASLLVGTRNTSRYERSESDGLIALLLSSPPEISIKPLLEISSIS